MILIYKPVKIIKAVPPDRSQNFKCKITIIPDQIPEYIQVNIAQFKIC